MCVSVCVGYKTLISYVFRNFEIIINATYWFYAKEQPCAVVYGAREMTYALFYFSRYNELHEVSR